MLIVLVLAWCMFLALFLSPSLSVCVFLLRRLTIILPLTTVKSVTCSFSFTRSIHRIHSPQLFIAFAVARIVCLLLLLFEWALMRVCEYLIFFFDALSLSLVHLNVSNVKITAKWPFHSIRNTNKTASMDEQRKENGIYSHQHIYVRFIHFFFSPLHNHIHFCVRWMYRQKINSKLWLSQFIKKARAKKQKQTCEM